MKKSVKAWSFLLCAMMTLSMTSCGLLDGGNSSSASNPPIAESTGSGAGDENEDKTLFGGRQSVLLMGQSNMAGRGDVNAVNSYDDDRIFMQKKDLTWTPMQEPIHYDKSVAGVGLAASFADAFVNTFDVEVGLVPCAMGGTSMDEWAVGGKYYNDTITRAKAAQKDSEICAILWHQGCSDQGNATGYAEKFKTMIDSLMRDLSLDAEKIVIVSGELGRFRTGDITNLHNEFYKIGDYYDNYGVASSEGLTAQDVTTHFDAPSLRVFGYRYFAAYYNILTDKTFTDFSQDPADYLKKNDSANPPESGNTNKPPVAPEGYLAVEDFANYDLGYAYLKDGVISDDFHDANGKYVSLKGASGTPYADVNAAVGVNKDFVFEADYRISSTFTAGIEIMKPIGNYNNGVKSTDLLWVGNNGVVYKKDKQTQIGVTLTNMEWTRISVVFHVAEKTRDIYVNGEPLLMGDSIADFTQYDIFAVRIAQCKNNTGSNNYVYVDNFECYYGTALK